MAQKPFYTPLFEIPGPIDPGCIHEYHWKSKCPEDGGFNNPGIIAAGESPVFENFADTSPGHQGSMPRLRGKGFPDITMDLPDFGQVIGSGKLAFQLHFNTGIEGGLLGGLGQKFKL